MEIPAADGAMMVNPYTTQPALFRSVVDGINCDTPADCIKSFIAILDSTDESEGGTKFHPVQISSVRVLESAKLAKVLEAMRIIAYKDPA